MNVNDGNFNLHRIVGTGAADITSVTIADDTQLTARGGINCSEYDTMVPMVVLDGGTSPAAAIDLYYYKDMATVDEAGNVIHAAGWVKDTSYASGTLTTGQVGAAANVHRHRRVAFHVRPTTGAPTQAWIYVMPGRRSN